MLLALAIIVFVIGWVVYCFEIVREDERAVKIRLGKTIKACESGPHFKIWPIESFTKISTKQQMEDFEIYDVVTAPGITEGRLSKEEKELLGKEGKRGHLHGAARLPVIKGSIYWFWPTSNKNSDPDGQKLIQLIKNIPIGEIKGFFVKPVIDATRTVYGRHTWRECIEEREQITTEIETILQELDGPFSKAGISSEEMNIVFTEIQLPDQLKNALEAPEAAKLMAIAEENKAKGLRESLKQEGLGKAEAIIAIAEAMKEKGEEGLIIQGLATIEKIGQGPGNTFFQIPTAIMEMLNNALAGRSKKK